MNKQYKVKSRIKIKVKLFDKLPIMKNILILRKGDVLHFSEDKDNIFLHVNSHPQNVINKNTMDLLISRCKEME